MTWFYFITRYWKWGVGIVATLALVGMVVWMKAEVAIAKRHQLEAQAQLAAKDLENAKALSEAQKKSLETQDRAAALVRNSAKTFDEKLAQIRARYAAKPRADARADSQPGGLHRPADQGPAAGSMPEAAGPARQPDGSAPDAGTARPLDERCAETTQQLLDLQEYVRNTQKLFNAH